MLIAAGVVLTACGAPDPGVAATRSRQIDEGLLIEDDPDEPDGPEVEIQEGVIDFGSNKPPQEHDAFITVAVKDVVAFMEQIYPELYGEPFPPLEGGIFAAYPTRPDSEPIPGCGEPTSSYEDVAGAGAFYCSLGDFVAYDDPFLADLVGKLGLGGTGIVMAHEFGHSIQARQDEFDQPTILMEQQADCFAGAWAARVARGESPDLTFGDNDVAAGLVAMIQVRDPVETTLDDPNAHGTGFDRVGAFQDGFTNGAIACKDYFENTPPLVPVQFQPDDPTGGNLPYFDETGDGNDILTLIPEDLTGFWTELAETQGTTFTAPQLTRFTRGDSLPSCDGVDESDIKDQITFCPSTNEILISDEKAFSLAEDPFTGDMSVGYLIATGYSESVLGQLGQDVSGEAGALLADCFTGVWTANIIPDETGTAPRGLVLSAGDLDEAIITAIIYADLGADENVNGSAFEKTSAFREGVLGGADACLS
jgi:predicted metalloprotease